MKELLIPAALHRPTGRIVAPHDGSRMSGFECPGCHADVVWRRESSTSNARRSHFAHAPDAECEPESAIHHAAKLLVAQQVTDWLAGTGPIPRFAFACSRCKKDREPKPIPDTTIQVSTEQTLPSGLRPDVSLWIGDERVMAIEILYTHALPDEKIQRLNADGVEWVELRAESILEPVSRWEVVRHHDTRPRWCADCIQERSSALSTQNEETTKAAAALKKQEARIQTQQAKLEAEKIAFDRSMLSHSDWRAFYKSDVERLSAESDALRAQAASLEARRSELVTESAQMAKRLSEDSQALKRAKLVDFDRLCENYREVFNKVELLRSTHIRMSSQVRRIEERMWGKPVTGVSEFEGTTNEKGEARV
jgi:hypothetical protein